MTVLEWLEKSTRYTFEEGTFEKIILDRGCNPQDDAYSENITKRQKNLMEADLIFTAVMLSPSSTSSLQQSHNGYQKTVGSESDVFQSRKIDYAISIYKMYDDEKAAILEATKSKIKSIPIVDVIRLC